MKSYRVGERRPLASRSWKLSNKAANWLAQRGISPNAISIGGMFCGIAAGVLFAQTPNTALASLCWIGGAVCVQLRLLANLYDGMVAVLRDTASPLGELYNEVPDRVSDSATLIGFGYAAGANPQLGFVAALFAVFLAYVRAQGKVAGAHQEFCGPMAKQQRMAVVTGTAVICGLFPLALQWRIPFYALWFIIAGALVTSVRRLHRITAAIQHR